MMPRVALTAAYLRYQCCLNQCCLWLKSENTHLFSFCGPRHLISGCHSSQTWDHFQGEASAELIVGHNESTAAYTHPLALTEGES